MPGARDRVRDNGSENEAMTDPFADPILGAKMRVAVSRVQARNLEWIAEPTEVGYDDHIVQILIDNLNAQAGVCLEAVNRQEHVSAYLHRLRTIGTSLIAFAEKNSVLKDPYSDYCLRELAESSGNFIEGKHRMTLELQEAEILEVIERLRVQCRSEAGRWHIWRNQLLFRIETRFEARYQSWEAEASDRVRSMEGAVGNKGRRIPLASQWEDIEMLFLSDARVENLIGDHRETLNYTELRFADRRNGTPNKGWLLLRELARASGELSSPPSGWRGWASVEKQMQRTKRILVEHFGISGNPLPFRKGVGYRSRFKIGCAPSFDT